MSREQLLAGATGVRHSFGSATGLAALSLLLCGVVGAARADTGWYEGVPEGVPEQHQLADPTIRLREGDIIEFASRPATAGLTTRGIGLRGPTSPWPDGIIPYVIHEALADSSADQVRLALEQWNEVSGITLLPREEAPAELQGDYLLFMDGVGCASWVGRRGGEQPLWVGPICTSGSIMHEIGHALGLEHEHTRPDRDQHIVIHRDRIDPAKLHNFEFTDYRSRMLGDYDYESIMHYGPSFFSLDGRATMEPLVPVEQPIGQRIAPSRGDIEAIAELYGTDLSLTARALNAEGSSGRDRDLVDVSLQVTNEHDQGAHGLTLSLLTDGLEVVGQSESDWRCERSSQVVDCRLQRLAGNASSAVTLTLRGQLDATGLPVSLKAVTPDDDVSNNASRAVLERSSDASDAVSEIPAPQGDPVSASPTGEAPTAPMPAAASASTVDELRAAASFSPWTLLSLIWVVSRALKRTRLASS